MPKKGLFVKDILVVGSTLGKNGEIHRNLNGKIGHHPVILNDGMVDNSRALRIIQHIKSIAETAKKNHKNGRYTRAITDEFSFYTSHTPLTLDEYKHIINETSKNLKGFPPNIILVMSSMPVQWPDGTLRNAVLHVQSPKDNVSDPIIHHFSKETFSWIDPYYAQGYNENIRLLFNPDNYNDPLYSPNVVLGGTKVSCNDVNQYKSAILVEGTGLSPLINTIDVCLDHCHGIAMRNAKELINQIPNPPLHVNHIVTSNSVGEKDINLAASTIHSDWHEKKVLGSIEKKNESIPTYFGDLINKSKAYIYHAKRVGLMHGDLFDRAVPKANIQQPINTRVDGDGNTLLHQVLIQESKSIQKESYFIGRLNKLIPYFIGDRMNQKNNLGNTPLHLAIQRIAEDDKLILFLLQGARLDIQNNLGVTPIALARHQGKISLLNKFYHLLSNKKEVYLSHRNTILDLLNEVSELNQKQKIAFSALGFEINEIHPKAETVIGLLQATQNNPLLIATHINKLLVLASSQPNLYTYLSDNNLFEGINNQTVKQLPQNVREDLLKKELAKQNPSADHIALFLSGCDIPCIFNQLESQKLSSCLMQSQRVYDELSRLRYESLIRDFAKASPNNANQCIERIVNSPVYFESVAIEALIHCSNNLNIALLKKKLHTIYPCCSYDKQKELFIQFQESDKIHFINYWLTKNANHLNQIVSPLAKKVAFLDIINPGTVVETIPNEMLVACMMNTREKIVDWSPLRHVNYAQLNYRSLYVQTLKQESTDSAYQRLDLLLQGGYPSVLVRCLYDQLKQDLGKQFLGNASVVIKNKLDNLFDPMQNLLQKAQANQMISQQEYTDCRMKFLNSRSCANYLKDPKFSRWILSHEVQTQGFPDSEELAVSIFEKQPLLANQEDYYKRFPLQSLSYLLLNNTQPYQAVRNSFPKKNMNMGIFNQFLTKNALLILAFENQLNEKDINSSLLQDIFSTFPLYDFKIKEKYPALLPQSIQIAKQNANQFMYDNLSLEQCPNADVVDSIIDFEKSRKNSNMLVNLIQNYPQQFFNHPSLGEFVSEVMNFLAANINFDKDHYHKIREKALQQLAVLPEETRQKILNCECSLGNNADIRVIQKILEYLPLGELDIARKIHNNDPLSKEVLQMLLERTLTSVNSREVYELIREKIDVRHSENARRIILQQNVRFNENRNSELIVTALRENIAIIRQLDKNTLLLLTADEVTRALEGIERVDLDIYALIQDKLIPSSDSIARLIINSEKSCDQPNIANMALACLHQPLIVSTLDPQSVYEMLNRDIDSNEKAILVEAMGENLFEQVYILSRNKNNREMLILLIENGGTGDFIQNKIAQLSTEDINSEPFIKLTQYKANLISNLAYRAIACNASHFISAVLKHRTVDDFLKYDDSLYDALYQNKDKPFLLKWILISFNKLLENQDIKNEIELAPAALSQPLLSLLNKLDTLYHQKAFLLASDIEALLPVICTHQDSCEVIQLAIQNSPELFTYENIQLIQENAQLQCDIKTANGSEDIKRLLTKYKKNIDNIEQEHLQKILPNIAPQVRPDQKEVDLNNLSFFKTELRDNPANNTSDIEGIIGALERPKMEELLAYTLSLSKEKVASEDIKKQRVNQVFYLGAALNNKGWLNPENFNAETAGLVFTGDKISASIQSLLAKTQHPSLEIVVPQPLHDGSQINRVAAEPQKPVLPNIENQVYKQALFKKHIDALEIQVNDLKGRRDKGPVGSDDYLKLDAAYNKANGVHGTLKDAGKKYFAKEISYADFKKCSDDVIKDAKPVLEEHRGGKAVLEVLTNIALFLVSLIRSAYNGKMTLFKLNTESVTKVNAVEDSVNKADPGA